VWDILDGIGQIKKMMLECSNILHIFFLCQSNDYFTTTMRIFKLRQIYLLLTMAILATGVADAATNLPKDPQGGNFKVTNYGAKGDGKTKDTGAVQSAIDSCATQGGGTVLFPAGTYLCGSIHLKNNVALFLDHGAVLRMSPDNADFDTYETLGFKTKGDKETSFFHYALIWGEDVSHLAILGTGTIDGNRTRRGGPKPIALKRCREVTIKDITIRDSPNYCISMLGTDQVNISGVTILNGYCDGMDPDGCKNVRISDCSIDCFDDAIVPKASFSLGYLRSVENLTVTNCILASNCNAFKFGTETGGGFKNVVFSNSTILARKIGKPADSGISLESVDGAEVEGVTISNIAMQDVISPIFLRLGNRGRDMETPRPGFVRNILISNITVTGASQASLLTGIPGYPVENVTICNVRVSCLGGGSFSGLPESVPELIDKYPDTDMFGPIPTYGFYCRHVKNLKLQEIDLTLQKPDPRSAFHFEDVDRLKFTGIEAEKSKGANASLYFRDAKQVIISNCRIPGKLSDYLQTPPDQRNEILMTNNFQSDK